MNLAESSVSIILPTYNRSGVLPDSIRSVLDQSYEDFELIVVDDGSTDDTEEVVSDFKDSRIRYIKHSTNRGAQAARNTGLKLAKGEFIAFQDSDDKWHPKKLEKQMDVFDTSPEVVGIVYTGIWRIRNDRKEYIPKPNVHPKEGDIRCSLHKFNFISLQTSVVRFQCFQKVGVFDENLPRLQDWELWIRMAEHFRFRCVDEPLVTSPIRSNSISQDDIGLAEARQIILDKHRNRFKDESLAEHLFRTGHSKMKIGQTVEGREYLFESLKINLYRVNFSAFMLSLFGSNMYRMVYFIVKVTRDRLHSYV